MQKKNWQLLCRSLCRKDIIMKKSLLIAGIAAAVMMSSSLTYAATTTQTETKTQTATEKQLPSKNCKDFKGKKQAKAHRPNLDDRLKLTEEQKQQAHEIRMKGHEKMKPVFEQMKAKKAEIRKIAESDLSQAEKEKKIAPLKNDLRELKKQAREIRMENTKEFEAILTPEQKAEFVKIKQEAREHAKKHHMKKQNRPCPKVK